MTPTVRLYWEEPTRKTALATVTGRASGGFTLDRTVFHAADTRYHHLQPEDRGYVLVDGSKRKLERVFWDAKGRLVHRTAGPPPPVGAKAQLHLDAPRRELQARAHTAMHLLVAAVEEQRGTWLEAPRVVGGGEVRLAASFREAPQVALQKVLDATRRRIAERHPVAATWAPRDQAAREVSAHVVALGAVAPDEPTLRLVRCGDSCLPCDAPLVEHAWQVGELRPTQYQPRADGVRWAVRVA